MNRYVIALVISLLVLPVMLISYRVISLGYPIVPAAPERVWQLSFKAHIHNTGDSSQVMIAFPFLRHGITLLEEKVTEGSMDFGIRTEDRNRYASWTGTSGPDGTDISYSITFMLLPASSQPAPTEFDPYPEGVDRKDQEVAEKLVSNTLSLQPAVRAMTIASAFTDKQDIYIHSLSDIEKWSPIRKKIGNMNALLTLFRAANLYTRPVEGLVLGDNITSETIRWIEVWTGMSWQPINPETGSAIQKPNALLTLTRGQAQAVRLIRGDISDIRWSISRQIITQWGVQNERIKSSERFLDRWSLFRLPPQFQDTFRILILVPLGALIICILRNIIGLPTFGIFMPVLMALAFRNTGLLFGLGIFSAVLLVGYGVRRSIDKLRLLLVPRLSVILTLVVACFIIFALIGNKLGLREFMAVGLLPFVILTLTIERFHIILEEQGASQALRTAAGSAAVATAAFGIIQFDPLQITFFVYPELLLVVMAMQILLGRYTGYRMMELLRFRQLGNKRDNKGV